MQEPNPETPPKDPIPRPLSLIYLSQPGCHVDLSHQEDELLPEVLVHRRHLHHDRPAVKEELTLQVRVEVCINSVLTIKIACIAAYRIVYVDNSAINCNYQATRPDIMKRHIQSIHA